MSAGKVICAGVDVTLGGGELGRGFYTGEYLHEAKAWAFHVSGDRQRNVVRLTMDDAEVVTLALILLDSSSASICRKLIRISRCTRSYLFGCDMVWAPIVGSSRATGDQYKWESKHAESLLNDPFRTTKAVI